MMAPEKKKKIQIPFRSGPKIKKKLFVRAEDYQFGGV
jgi:hypothetical protein